MAKFMIKPTILSSDVDTVRVGAGAGSANNWTDAEKGKLVRLVAESRYDLCAVGNDIEGIVSSVEGGTTDGFTIGGVYRNGKFEVTFDGLQATPGTGVIAVGDIVVAGTPVAKGTKLPGAPTVCKATTAADVVHKWRVVSLGAAGTGAVGTTGVIERI